MFARWFGTFATVHVMLAGGFGHAAERFEFKSVHMGTEWRIVLYADDRATAKAASEAAFARVKQLDEVMSDYNPKSELMTLLTTNDATPGKPIPASDDLICVLAHAQEVSAKCDGAFDVTVGPLVKLWRAARKSKELPKAEELAAAKTRVGHKLVTVDVKSKTVTLTKAGMRLDLGGIGKGYAADEALTVLKAKGLSRALVAASGDITVGDAPPDRDAWVVDIAPISKDRPARQLKLVNSSVSTSGDLFQFVEVGGVRYSHVLDPKTGLGLTGRRSATVVAPTGWQADALTKAASVLAPERALKLIDGVKGTAMYLVVKETDDAKEQVTESAGFAAFILEPKSGK
jgi:thiamine biosynthesis lipoprotein